MPNRRIFTDPTLKYWRVKLSETIGTVTVQGWVRHIWAKDKQEAATKAIVFHMKRNPGARPLLKVVERETYDGPIRLS